MTQPQVKHETNTGSAAEQPPKQRSANANANANANAIDIEQQSDTPQTGRDFSFGDIEQFFHELISRSQKRWRNGMPNMHELGSMFSSRLPNVDIIDRRKKVIIKAELPGCEKNDVKLTISDVGINIAAKCEEEHQNKGDNYLRQEIFSREYCRTIALPNGVDTSKVTAKMKGGILRITLPKKRSGGHKRIAVS